MQPRWTLAPLVVLAAAAAARAQEAWHASLEKGLDAAKRSGRPVLVVTIWNRGVCASCDAWRERVRPDAEFVKQLRRYEPVEWLYDGLGGKVVKWTLANGGKSSDPSAQLFVVGADGKLRARLDDAKVATPAAVANWLAEQADAWEREHPRSAVPFARAAVALEGEGTARTAVCAELEAARAANRPVLLYVSRDGAPPDGAADEKSIRAETAASRKLEKTLLDSKQVADAAAGFVLLRLDLSDESHRVLASALGAESAPALLLWEPGAEKPARLPTSIAAPDLAFKLRKAAGPPATEK